MKEISSQYGCLRSYWEVELATDVFDYKAIIIRNGSNKIIKWKHYRCGEVTDVYNTGKGYAFVTMVDEDAAQAAMRELNGASIDGQPIKVGIDSDTMDPKSCDCIWS